MTLLRSIILLGLMQTTDDYSVAPCLVCPPIEAMDTLQVLQDRAEGCERTLDSLTYAYTSMANRAMFAEAWLRYEAYQDPDKWFRRCAAGSAVLMEEWCQNQFDQDGDGDGDMNDFGIMQRTTPLPTKGVLP